LAGIWSLKPGGDSSYDKFIVLSFVGETRVLAMTGEELEETEVPGFQSDEQTIYCGNVTNNQIVQVRILL
jgi:DNA damage-binding protein 1